MKKYPSPCIVLAIFLFLDGILNAQLKHHPFQYVSPRPDAKFVSRTTTIIVRPSEVLTKYRANLASLFKVQGAASGIHTGDAIIASNQKTIIFKPHRSFEPGESVSVTIGRNQETNNGDEIAAFSYKFNISSMRGNPRQSPLQYHSHEWQSPVQNHKDASRPILRNQDISLPLDFPAITVTEFNDPAPGNVFLSPFSLRLPQPLSGALPKSSQLLGPGNYLAILDNTAFPIFFRRMPDVALDFKKQRSSDLLTYYLVGPDYFYGLDNSYTVVDSFLCGNGYTTDFHDLQVLANGNALMMSYDPQIVDMSQIVEGGATEATVIGLIIQEIDREKNVIFEWRSWDHFQITDATLINLTAAQIDYVHGNAIEVDFDENLLISSRHIEEITKIDRQTGEIIWRFGGENNQFTFTNDTMGFSLQHDIRRLANGNITLYDNGNLHQPPFSRAVEYQIDEQNLTATVVWQYPDTPDIFGPSMGSTQRLPNGNTVIGWGRAQTALTEVRPDGSKAFEITLEPDIFTYNAFRFPWSAVAAAPYLWADSSSSELILNFVRFGAKDVVKYYIYQATSSNPSTKIDSTTSNSIVINGLADGVAHSFRVTSLDDQGNESPFSNEIQYGTAVTGFEKPDSQIPEEYFLFPNYPNPFNIMTAISYALKEDTEVTLKLYNVLGQKVRTLVNENQAAGFKSVIWDGRNDFGSTVSTGIYIFTLRVNNQTFSKKMLLLK